MIRRWSYLNNFNFDLNLQVFFFLRFKNYKLIKAVNYKNFSIGLTKFIRPKLAKRKRNTIWLPHTSVFKFWIKDYNLFKKIAKSQYLDSIFLYSYLIYDFNYIKKKNILNDTNNFTFVGSSVPNFFFFYFFKKYLNKNTLLFIKLFNYTNFSSAFFLTPLPSFNEKIFPLLIKKKNYFYRYGMLNSKRNNAIFIYNNLILCSVLNIYKNFILFYLHVKLFCLLKCLN